MIRFSCFLMLLAAFSMSSCELGFPAGSEPFSELNYTDMGNQPKLKPQRTDIFGGKIIGMTEPAEGSIAMGETPYRFTEDEFKLAAEFYKNPLKESPKTLKHGEWIYTNYCIVCHGEKAAGDGHITKLFPKPPHLMRQKVRDFTDGRIFHIANRGQASMPSYAKQLEPDDIWSVVWYIRKLQQKSPVAAATIDDLKELERIKTKEEADPTSESTNVDKPEDTNAPAESTESGGNK